MYILSHKEIVFLKYILSIYNCILILLSNKMRTLVVISIQIYVLINIFFKKRKKYPNDLKF